MSGERESRGRVCKHIEWSQVLIGLRERVEEGWHAVRVYYLPALEVGGVFRQRRGTHEGGQARLQRLREAADMQRVWCGKGQGELHGRRVATCSKERRTGPLPAMHAMEPADGGLQRLKRGFDECIEDSCSGRLILSCSTRF